MKDRSGLPSVLDDVKLEWLTYRSEDLKGRIESRILDASGYTRARKPDQILHLPLRDGEPSLGYLVLPTELLRMMFVQLDPCSAECQGPQFAGSFDGPSGARVHSCLLFLGGFLYESKRRVRYACTRHHQLQDTTVPNMVELRNTRVLKNLSAGRKREN